MIYSIPLSSHHYHAIPSFLTNWLLTLHHSTFLAEFSHLSRSSHVCVCICPVMSARLLYPQDFPGKNTGVCCHFLFQGIFPTRDQSHGTVQTSKGKTGLTLYNDLEILGHLFFFSSSYELLLINCLQIILDFIFQTQISPKIFQYYYYYSYHSMHSFLVLPFHSLTHSFILFLVLLENNSIFNLLTQFLPHSWHPSLINDTDFTFPS